MNNIKPSSELQECNFVDYLLTDEEMITFVIHGYHIVETDFTSEFNQSIYDEIEQLDGNPGDGILDAVPKLYQVYQHPKVNGALASLLGHHYEMSGHRHCHVNPVGSRSQGWHQDGVNQRHHQIQTVLAMYYPQDVNSDMGPTVIVPGTHFRNAPTDQMATYTNFRHQLPLTVKAGTVAITHYDIWHAASRNKGDRTRYMLKFLFNRKNDPDQPWWNHDPVIAKREIHRLDSERAGACSQSDHYKERGLRRQMWLHLLGRKSSKREE